MIPYSVRRLQIRVGIALLVIVLGATAYFQYVQHRAVEGIARDPGRERVEGTGSGSWTPRMREVHMNRGRDPVGAVQSLDEVLAKPAGESERREAQRLLPETLHYAALHELKAGRKSEAAALRARLEKNHPASPSVGFLQNDWRRELAGAASRAIRGEDRSAEQAAIAELWTLGPTPAERFVFEQWLQQLLERHRQARANNAAGTAEILEAAAVVVADSHSVSRVAQALAEAEVQPKALAERGDQLAATAPGIAALGYWAGALRRLEGGRGTWADEKEFDPRVRAARSAELNEKIAAKWIEIGDRLARGERLAYVLVSPREAYEAGAAAGRGRVEEMQALVRLFDWESGELARLAEPVTRVSLGQLAQPERMDLELRNRMTSAAYDVRGKIRNLLGQHGVRLWECCLETPGYDPWPSVPPAVREAIDAAMAVKPASASAPATAVPPKSAAPSTRRPVARASPARPAPAPQAATAPSPETERRRRLFEHFRSDPLGLPLAEVQPLRELLHQVYARWGLSLAGGTSDEAYTMLREALRESGDAELRRQLGEALRGRIRHSREKGKFEEFYLLAGFYAGEVGLPAAGDPFRDEFRRGVEAARDSFRGRERMKFIFMLSLLAQSFPEDPIGRQAQTEAFAAAFAEVTGEEASRSGSRAPSPLPGHAVELFNNSTAHHLLAFYRGPAQVAVHNWPWRRGTVVVPDGDYELVVLSPERSIRGYRTRLSLRGGVRTSDYHVQSSGPSQAQSPMRSPGIMAGGDYRLLFAPAAVGTLQVDPRSGLPAVAR
jgi:hypothetical protein